LLKLWRHNKPLKWRPELLNQWHSVTSQNTRIAATLLLWHPQICPGSWSCTVLSQHRAEDYKVTLLTIPSIFKSTVSTSIHKQNVCSSYCRRAFNYVPAAVTHMISRILHASLLCETQHLTLQFTYTVSGTTKICHVHLHVWDIMASLNAQKYLNGNKQYSFLKLSTLCITIILAIFSNVPFMNNSVSWVHLLISYSNAFWQMRHHPQGVQYSNTAKVKCFITMLLVMSIKP
jgi:hypothetical protein